MKLSAEQLGKLNSAMDTLSLNQEPAREDMSTIAAMSVAYVYIGISTT